jgi:type I restriction enzyme, S subunit
MEKQMNRPQLRFPEFQWEWEKKKLEFIGEYIGGGTPSTSVLEYWEGDIPWISSSDINENDIHNINIQKYITDEAVENSATKKIPSNSLLIVSRVGVGKFAINKSIVCTSQDFTNIVIDTKVFNANFSAFNLYKNIDILHNISQGTSIKGFTIVDLKKTELSFPSLPEQTKIANFLTAVDEKIQALKKKKSLLEQYKKSVMQRLFSSALGLEDDRIDEENKTEIEKNPTILKSQKSKFRQKDGSDFPEWELKKLGEVLIKNSNKNKGQKYTLVQSVSNKHGFINQDEMFEDRRVASKDTSNYYVIEKGHFAYNPSRIDVGSLAYKYDNEVSTISPLYISFRANQEFLTDNFLLNWFSTEQFQMQMNNSFEGSVRNTLSYESLIKMDISIPSIEEQTHIANFLSAIDDKITHTATQIEKMEAWKKGLLQKMFV